MFGVTITLLPGTVSTVSYHPPPPPPTPKPYFGKAAGAKVADGRPSVDLHPNPPPNPQINWLWPQLPGFRVLG